MTCLRLPSDAPAVLLDGAALSSLPTRQIAQTIGLLPQSPVAPEAITVGDLVARGRQPHQHWWQQWSEADERAVSEAMARTSVADLADRPVDALSGGQRQRVWIAMALAQDTELLLLDEPTTFLDIAHQVEVLDLIRRLNRERGRTVVAEGPPSSVVTAELVEEVFGLASLVIPDPVTGSPLVIPGAPWAARP